MLTRPRVLNSDWYLYEVYDTIPRALLGAQEWFSKAVANERDRDTFEHTMQSCREMCERKELRYDVPRMRESLLAFREGVIGQFGKDKVWSVFRPKTLFSDGLEYHLKAIDLCLELIDGITKKYLIHS
jgi:hypothetical protein